MMVIFVVVFAVSGVGYMVASHADPITKKPKTNKFVVKAVRCSVEIKSYQQCTGKLKKSNADLFVVGMEGTNLQCTDNKRKSEWPTITTNGDQNSFHNFGKSRTIFCTPGKYHLYLAGTLQIESNDPDKPVTKLFWEPIIPARTGATQRAILGSIQ